MGLKSIGKWALLAAFAATMFTACCPTRGGTTRAAQGMKCGCGMPK